jgi:hypothetical protein
MNVISFKMEVLDDLTLTPCVDGIPLDVLVEDFEKRQGKTMLPAGGYGGVVPATYRFRSFLDYFMGEEGVYGHPPGTVYLLFCSCGEPGCWPLQARILICGDSVLWGDFKQPHRPDRDYRGFGPFEFEREEYEATVREVLFRNDRAFRG